MRQINGSIYRTAVITLLFLLSVMSVPVFSADSTSLEDRKAIESAIAAVKPALVRIFVAEVDYQRGREVKNEAAGSGVIISKEGYVVTNHHVAGWAKRLVCTMSNREEVEADLVGTDPLTDIAVIKLRPKPGFKEFPFAKWGDSSELNVGDRVLAMGSPLALSQSVTMGIVSNTEMVIPDFYQEGMMTLDGEDVGSMVRWIGHDATIEPGNSGGPLVNIKGEVVGINEISFGLAGTIPSNIANQVSSEIIKSGKISRAWIGLTAQPLLKSSGMDKGVLIGSVMYGAPASKAGLKTGDILLKVAGKNISVRFAEEIPIFNQTIAALPIGKEADFVVLRDGKEVTLKVTPQERPEAEPRPSELKQWGMCISNLSLVKARSMRRDTQDGALVRSIASGGPCGEAKPAIEEEDVIVEVAGKPVKNVQDLVNITNEVTKDKTEPTPVLVSFDRGTERLVTVVKVGIKDLEDPGREVKKAYLPVGMQVITSDIAEALGIGDKTGVRVTQVYAGSSAEKAGLKVGDLIVALDGEEIPASQPEDTEVLPAMIRQYKIGSTAELSVIRGKDEIKVPVVLEESPALQREMRKYRDETFEFTARDLAQRDRIKESIEKNITGVYVEEISEGGWAALGRLNTGDIITKVDGTPIQDVSGLRDVMLQIEQKKPKYVVLTVRRGVQQRFIEMETDWGNGK